MPVSASRAQVRSGPVGRQTWRRRVPSLARRKRRRRPALHWSPLQGCECGDASAWAPEPAVARLAATPTPKPAPKPASPRQAQQASSRKSNRHDTNWSKSASRATDECRAGHSFTVTHTSQPASDRAPQSATQQKPPASGKEQGIIKRQTAGRPTDSVSRTKWTRQRESPRSQLAPSRGARTQLARHRRPGRTRDPSPSRPKWEHVRAN